MINLNSINDNLLGTSWVGEVIDIEDPLQIGRVRVRVFGKFDTRENPYDSNSKYIIPDDAIPWAYPSGYFSGGSQTGSGSFSVPKEKSIVNIKFENGNIYYPEYSFQIHLSEDLINEIKESYKNAHSLIYDTVTEGGIKIFFTENKGLILDYKSNTFNIKPDESIEIKNVEGDTIVLTKDGDLNIDVRNNVNINCNTAKVSATQDVNIDCNNAKVSASQKVHLDSSNVELGRFAIESVIKGNTFQALFNSHIHLSPSGLPTTPPVIPLNGSELSLVSKTE